MNPPTLFAVDPLAPCICGHPTTLLTVHRPDAPCFRWEPPDVNHLGRFQAHSETSRRAALANLPRTGTQRARVLAAISAGGANGSTDEETALRLGLSLNSVRPRRIELVEGGHVRALVDEDGADVHRKTRAGNDALVWVAARRKVAP